MFKSDVTQNYTQQDATLEILVMLGGAFLLGCLLCWLIKSLVKRNKHSRGRHTRTSKHQTVHNVVNADQNESSQVGNSSRQARAVEGQPTSNYATARIDDLTKISGITPEVQNLLKHEGIMSFTDLRDAKNETLILTSGMDSDPKVVETWHHQSSLAAKGQWKKLTEYQNFTQRARVASDMSNHKDNGGSNAKGDDLKKIEGIGPRIEDILNSHGIYTFKELRETDRDTLKSYLVKADSRFQNNETESWPHQAGMAEKGQWEELKIYQEFIDEDDDESLYSDHPSDVSLTTKRAPFSNNVSNITENDDLKKIEGIGPKIEELLNKNDIYSFSNLKEINEEVLKSILEKAGPQYRMHDPKSWPEQAKMASNGDWGTLTEYQDFLLGGRE
jgi:predicted flap endonuclease-1-like 5' DNA nuclease